jgi:hypothetical protein
VATAELPVMVKLPSIPEVIVDEVAYIPVPVVREFADKLRALLVVVPVAFEDTMESVPPGLVVPMPTLPPLK